MAQRAYLSSALAACAGVLALACEPDPDPGVCDGEGEAAVELRQRGADDAIVDGSDLPVFPPPQGGVWTEVDVSLLGVRVDDVQGLRVDITDSGGVLLGAESYRGDGLPLACQMDGSIKVDNMPVGFNEDTVLQELEGVPATMTTTFTHAGGETVITAMVTLRVDVF